VSSTVLDALEGVLGNSEDADDALRETVQLLVAEPGIAWAAIAFLDEGVLTPGPAAGVPDESLRVTTQVTYEGTLVGELSIDGTADPDLLQRVASLIAAHVLIGWDTGGVTWEP
jgi:hypothetical protein